MPPQFLPQLDFPLRRSAEGTVQRKHPGHPAGHLPQSHSGESKIHSLLLALMYLFCDKVEEFFLDVDCEDMRYPYPVKAIVKTYPGLIAKHFDNFSLNKRQTFGITLAGRLHQRPRGRISVSAREEADTYPPCACSNHELPSMKMFCSW